MYFVIRARAMVGDRFDLITHGIGRLSNRLGAQAILCQKRFRFVTPNWRGPDGRERDADFLLRRDRHGGGDDGDIHGAALAVLGPIALVVGRDGYLGDDLVGCKRGLAVAEEKLIEWQPP